MCNNKLQYQRTGDLVGYQIDFMDDPARYTVVEAATKTGKTTACIIWLMEQAMKATDNQVVWWVAPIFGQARIAHLRMLSMLRKTAEQLTLPKGVHLFTTNKMPMQIELANGARIEFKSADHPDSLYGEDVQAAVIDEATRCREDSWHAVRSTLTATGGPIKIIGNVRGRHNWVHKLAHSGVGSYHRISAYDAVDAGILSKAEIEDAKNILPESTFRELYLAEPSDDGGNPFGLQNIEACAVDPARLPGEGRAQYFGIDVARAVDYSAIMGISQDMQVCQHHHWQESWELTYQKIKQVVGHNKALLDATGVGDPIFERLKHDCRALQPFKYSSTSKQQLMELLASYFSEQAIRLPCNSPLHNELVMFEYQLSGPGRVKYSAPEGLHDDCVNALALAIRAREDSKKRLSPLLYR